MQNASKLHNPNPCNSASSPFSPEPHPEWVAFFTEALRLEKLAIQRRAERLQAERDAANDTAANSAAAPEASQSTTELS